MDPRRADTILLSLQGHNELTMFPKGSIEPRKTFTKKLVYHRVCWLFLFQYSPGGPQAIMSVCDFLLYLFKIVHMPFRDHEYFKVAKGGDNSKEA